ncbi:MAG TPA: hypothetical protein VOA87_03210 [Thermoanaerobaculia bacterium]|nr:hypothetical protein [Thermoanaerobaculia bacterium]
METAKVDIRKLQFLNDRINQCLDALTQVRLSVHGLSHTSINPLAQQAGFGQVGFAGQDPRFGLGAGQLPQTGFPSGFAPQGFAPGLSHTPINPMITPMIYGGPQANVNPFVPFGAYGNPQVGWNPYVAGLTGGLSHTGVESVEGYARPTWGDPLLAQRVVQTFPYAQFAVPPVVSLY